MAQPDAERKLHIGEIDMVGFRFRGSDLPEGVIISSSAVAVLPATGLTLGSGTGIITADGDATYAWVTAVTGGGVDYDVTFTVIFSDTKKLIRVYRVTVL